MKYYLVIRWNEVFMYAKTWIKLEHPKLSKKHLKKGYILHDSNYVTLWKRQNQYFPGNDGEECASKTQKNF